MEKNRRIMQKRLAAWILAVAAAAMIVMGCENPSDTNDTWPNRDLSAEDALTVDGSELLSIPVTRGFHKHLDTLGNRPTASLAHDSYIDWLYEQLTMAGVTNLSFENVEMERWTAEAWSLSSLKSDGSHDPVPVASYVPYSGSTTKKGISGELEYLTRETADDLKSGSITFNDLAGDFSGKIVLLDLPGPPLLRSWMGIGQFITLIDGLRTIGAKGMVVINNSSGIIELSRTYIPYDGEIRDFPGVFVDKDTGDTLRSLAGDNGSVTMTLSARVETVNSRNLIGFIPGKSDQVVAIHSHTDGTNGTEDNGPNVIIDIAQYVSRLPKDSLERGVMIMLSSGHFAGGNGIEGFINRHKTDGLLDRIAAVVTIEHLGLKHWRFNNDGELVPTGLKEVGAFFTPDIPALKDAAKAWRRNANSHSPLTVVLPPLHPEASGTPNDAVWPGEGQYFWGLARIPTVNYITGSDYLLNWGMDTMDFMDFELLHTQTEAFTQMVLDLTRTPAEDFQEASDDDAPAFTQAESGPGGSDYPYASYTQTAFTSNNGLNSWIFQPSPLPEGPVPVIAYLHGWYFSNGLNINENLVIHLTKKGYAVIYCNYQNLVTLPRFFEQRAAANVRDGLDYMAAHPDTCVRIAKNPDGSVQFGLLGWSAGGVMAVDLAANYQEDGIPKPGFVMTVEASNGGIWDIPMADASSISPDTNILMVMAEEDVESTFSTSSTFFNQMAQIPDTQKQWIGLYTDDYDTPALVADHGWVTSGRNDIDALDYYGSYKWSVAIANDTFYGTDRNCWYGNTDDQTFMGLWSDGTPVTPAEVSLTPFWPGNP